MSTNQLIEQIDRVIKEVWAQDIKTDYERFFLLREDTLKNSFYFHLRTKLAPLLEEHNLRIYTEYYVKELKYRADLAIVRIDPESEEDHLENMVTNTLAIFELKYGGYYADKFIQSDVPKLKSYVQKMSSPCQFYFAVIFEAECTDLRWFTKKQTNNWASGRVTELNAGYLGEKLEFQVHGYNDMNLDLNTNLV